MRGVIADFWYSTRVARNKQDTALLRNGKPIASWGARIIS
jgi:hypothetical protein